MTFDGTQVQNQIYISGESPWPVGAEAWEARAVERLDAGPYGYIAGGAGAESTVRANREAFERRRLRPRMLAAHTERDLSVEVAKAKATGAEVLIAVSRLNDAILTTRELVKQRWSPTAILSIGPGWYEDQYLKTLGKLGDGPISLVPWYDPNKPMSKKLEAALAKSAPGVGLSTNHVYTFEALLIAADAYKRAGSADPKALAEAIRKTNITNNVSPGPGIQFDAKGQNDKLQCSAIQNRGGKLVTVAPKAAANAKVQWPMLAYDKRR